MVDLALLYLMLRTELMKLLTTILLITILGQGFAQKQGNIWYFGNGAGLNFNSYSPSAIVGGQISYINGSHSEGCSVISDSSGSLLFYSNGMTVWNRNHEIMPNGDGLMGNYSSTQSALIVPQPNSNRYFYLFTTNAFCCGGDLSNGLRYSKIDMCLDHEYGDVISNEKNMLLIDTTSEKIAATVHINGIDFWIVTHKYFSDEFYALRLTPTGILDTVISKIGSVHSGSVAGAQGQLKFSSNGQLSAVASSNGNDLLELFDFNNSTGIVSNYRSLNRTNNGSVYGVEFSPDNSKLYAFSCAFSPFGTNLTQYNLEAGGGNIDSINSSMNLIYHQDMVVTGRGLQIGPDGKIYMVSQTNDKYLAVIHNPDFVGKACYFQD